MNVQSPHPQRSIIPCLYIRNVSKVLGQTHKEKKKNSSWLNVYVIPPYAWQGCANAFTIFYCIESCCCNVYKTQTVCGTHTFVVVICTMAMTDFAHIYTTHFSNVGAVFCRLDTLITALLGVKNNAIMVKKNAFSKMFVHHFREKRCDISSFLEIRRSYICEIIHAFSRQSSGAFFSKML